MKQIAFIVLIGYTIKVQGDVVRTIGNTFKYLYNNILALTMLAFLPACYIGALLQPFLLLRFTVNYYSTPINNYGHLLSEMFNASWANFGLSIFAFIILVVFMSIILGNTEYHFKSGKDNFREMGSYINNNIITVVAYCLIFMLCYLLYIFSLSVIVFLFHFILSGNGNVPTLANYIVTCVIFAISFLGFLYTQLFILISVPEAISTGYGVKNSILNVNNMPNKRWVKMFIGLILPFLITTPIVVLGMLFNLVIVANIIAFIFMFMYIPVFIYFTYYKLCNLEGKALPSKRYFWQINSK